MVRFERANFDHEIVVQCDPEQKRLYKSKNKAERTSSIYYKHRLVLPDGTKGRQQNVFAEIAVRAALKKNFGYRVLISELRVPDGLRWLTMLDVVRGKRSPIYECLSTLNLNC